MPIKVNHDRMKYKHPVTGKTKEKTITYCTLHFVLQEKNPLHTSKSFIPIDVAVPAECDLIELKTDKNRVLHGWWTGQEFFSRNKRPNETILSWKKDLHQGDL
jgi:hypothetical protein